MKLETVVRTKVRILIGVAVSTLLVVLLDYFRIVPASSPVAPVPLRQDEASAGARLASEHGGTLVTVVSVVDGDTIRVEGGETVRYIGMNTPETVAPGRGVECYGKEASARNKELVEGKTVELETDVSNRDKYGRLLRHVWIGETLVSESLVRDGFAQVSTYPPDVTYQDRLIAAQQLAMDEHKGLWGSRCPTPTPGKPRLP